MLKCTQYELHQTSFFQDFVVKEKAEIHVFQYSPCGDAKTARPRRHALNEHQDHSLPWEVYYLLFVFCRIFLV